MQACRVQSTIDACRFTGCFSCLTLADQLGMIANCIEVQASVLRECSLSKDRLAEWISAE